MRLFVVLVDGDFGGFGIFGVSCDVLKEVSWFFVLG